MHLEAVVASDYPTIRAPGITAQLGSAAKLFIIGVDHDVVVATARTLIDPKLDALSHKSNIVRAPNWLSSREALSKVISAGVQAYVTQVAGLAPRQLLAMLIRNLQQHIHCLFSRELTDFQLKMKSLNSCKILRKFLVEQLLVLIW
jgi:hypothetical protein